MRTRTVKIMRRSPFWRWITATGLMGLTLLPAAPTLVRVWSHQGQEAENRALREIVRSFEHAHADRGWRVELTFFPDFQYTEKLAVAAAARDLPDTFDVDGPLVARFADAGLIAPLDRWFSPGELADFLPTILSQSTIGDQLYALGAFDSALVLYYDRAALDKAGVVPPPDGRAWAWDEFLEACGKLAKSGIEPVALHMNESADEWFTYAFSPVLWSGGGRLFDEREASVRGVLGDERNVRSLRRWQELFSRGFAAADPVDPDPFGHGRVAMDWNGHWVAKTHQENKGAQLGVMPLPYLEKPAAPCGSWCWVVSADAANTEAAIAWLRWITGSKTGVAPLVRANGAVPARRSAFADFLEYTRQPYSLFRTQLETTAQPRPRTPYYAALTQHFAAALRDIAHGADVKSRLREAENEIQRVIDRRRAAKKPSP